MKKIVSFSVYGDIKPKARPRAMVMGGHAHIYTPKDTLYYENYIKEEYLRQVGNVRFNGALRVDMNFYFKPSATLKELLDRTGVSYDSCSAIKVHKDLDNLAKTFMDALHICYDDDKQIVVLNVRKNYTKCDSEYVQVTIYELEDVTEIDLKNMIKLQRTTDYIKKLLSKPKLNAKESIRLEELKKEYKEIKGEDYGY